MKVRSTLGAALCASSLVASTAWATNILAVGENRAGVYELSYTGDPTVASDWSQTVKLYSAVSLNTNEDINSVVADSAGNIYLSTFNTTANRILEISTSGVQTTLATEGQGAAATAGWTSSGAQGLTIGPDGKLYFGTAFNSGSQGVFSLNTDGSDFTQVTSAAPTGGTTPERDLTFVGSNLWVTARQSGTNLYEYSITGANLASAASGHTNAQTIAYGNDGNLYIGSETGGSGWIEQYNISTNTSAPVYTGTGQANALGMFVAPGATNTGGVLFSDYDGGTGSSGQIRVADATADVAFSFSGLTDPLDPTGATTLTGYKLDDLIVAPSVPEPASIGLLAAAALLVRRRRHA